MSTNLPKELRRNTVKKTVYFASKRLFRLAGKPPEAMRTDLTCGGKPVLFLHAPKSAGTRRSGAIF